MAAKCKTEVDHTSGGKTKDAPLNDDVHGILLPVVDECGE